MKTRRQKAVKTTSKRIELGEYIVADPAICHGKPIKGTRIMVWQVLDDVAEGRSWDFICNARWGGKVPIGAIGEAVKLAQAAFLNKHGRLSMNGDAKRKVLAAA